MLFQLVITLKVPRENWKSEKNQIPITIIKRRTSDTICGTVLSCDMAKEFVDAIGQKRNMIRQRLKFS